MLKCVNGEILEMTQEEIEEYMSSAGSGEEQTLEDRINDVESVLSNLINAEVINES